MVNPYFQMSVTDFVLTFKMFMNNVGKVNTKNQQ